MQVKIQRTNKINVQSSIYRLLFDRPAFLLAAIPPWRFIPFWAGRAERPLDNRHSSRREPRGPWVETRVDFESEVVG